MNVISDMITTLFLLFRKGFQKVDKLQLVYHARQNFKIF